MNPQKVMKEGLLEKRSSGLLQLWKTKHCILTEDGLRLQPCRRATGGASLGFDPKTKELRFERMAGVDCVEHKRGLVYFTIVMVGGEEIDFRCEQEGTPWNAEIALALVRFKNLLAVQTGRMRLHSNLGSAGEDEAPESR